MDPTHPTGGGAIAALLRAATCPIKTLNLSWNSIRSSGIPIAKALTVNRSGPSRLVLQQSRNEAVEVLGNGCTFLTLVTSIKQTKMQARGCFVVVRRLLLSHSAI